ALLHAIDRRRLGAHTCHASGSVHNHKWRSVWTGCGSSMRAPAFRAAFQLLPITARRQLGPHTRPGQLAFFAIPRIEVRRLAGNAAMTERSSAFTDSDESNTEATSGSSTTATKPRRLLEANRLGRACR